MSLVKKIEECEDFPIELVSEEKKKRYIDSW